MLSTISATYSGCSPRALSIGLCCRCNGCLSPQGREKINLVYLFTKMGFSILVSDVDTVWMRNPLPYMAQYPEADVLTSSDHLVLHWPAHASGPRSLVVGQTAGHEYDSTGAVCGAPERS